MVKIGVLALQGAFSKHIEMLSHMEIEAVEVRKPEDLDKCDGLIIPGGESTTILYQLKFIRLYEKIKEFALSKPIFGTCAGLILISKAVTSGKIDPFSLLDIQVERNGFGRQSDSFKTDVEVHLHPKKTPTIVSALFIRAPRIKSCGPSVEVLAKFEDEPILVKQGFHLGATFHPELTHDSSIHRYFLSLVNANKSKEKK